MTNSLIFSLLCLLLAAATATALNATSEWRFDGCAGGDTGGECITVAIEQEEVSDGISTSAPQKTNYLNIGNYPSIPRQPICNQKMYADCIGFANSKDATCTLGARCKKSIDKTNDIEC